MPKLKELNYEIIIKAPKEEVYKTMLFEPTYDEWTVAFSEGSTYEGDWSVGSKIKFVDPNGSGMYSEIVENRENDFVSIRHIGEVKNGVIDTESELVKSWMPCFENYTFTEINGETKLEIYLESTQEYAHMFDDMWPKALAKLKEICEK